MQSQLFLVLSICSGIECLVCEKLKLDFREWAFEKSSMNSLGFGFGFIFKITVIFEFEFSIIDSQRHLTVIFM
jgi:hypothetical protein